MELFQLVCAAMVQGVGRPRGLGHASLCNTLHNRVGMWRWKLLKVLVSYKLQLTKQKRERMIEVVQERYCWRCSVTNEK